MENKEAIEMLERFQNPEPWEPQITSRAYEALEMAIAALKKQEQDRWIPITEKPPEPYKEVIVTDIETIDTYTSEYYGDGYWGTDTGPAKNRIVAWRPLPEPYTEEKDNE